MKKTISINISGVIFHIEEDGYEKLKHYLQSIQQYFSTYDDSQEIVTDIENRIAEKLLQNLKGDDKTPARQAVTLDDVNGLIAKMGTVADFEAVENDEVLVAGGSRAKTSARPGAQPGGGTSAEDPADAAKSTTPPPPGTSYSYRSGQYEYERQYDPATGRGRSSYRYGDRKLARDLRRKTLGGVAAGLGHYFMIDPVWMRVLLVGLVIGFPVIGDGLGDGDGLFGSLSGVVVVAYILLWILLPGDTTLEEEKSVKKFYRNPDDKVLGGVAAGLAAYFAVETSVVRILLVVSVFFFGIGVLAYIVLWAVAPEARSLTEKMEMTGKPITLVNIESSVKSNLNVPPTAPESGLTQLLLFPFRAIAAVFRVLGRVFGKTVGGLASVIRVLFGLFMLLVGASFMIGSFTVFGAGIGLLAGTNFGPGDGGIPLSILREDAPFITLVAGFLLAFLPSLALALTGLMVIARRSFISGSTALTLLGVWVISGIIVGTTVPQIVRQFSRRGNVETSSQLLVAGTPTFTMINTDDAEFQDSPRIELLGYSGTTIKVVQTASARGATRTEAEINARDIQYVPIVTDSVVAFHDEFVLPDNVRFRNQELTVKVYVPVGRVFRMSPEFGRYIVNRFSDQELDAMPNNRWQFTPTGLTGVGFERTLDREDDRDEFNRDEQNEDDVDVTTSNQETRTFVFGPTSATTAPNAVLISGNYAVRFLRGNQLKMVVNGDQGQYDAIEATNENGTLRVEQRNGNDERVGLTITLPSLSVLRLSGSTEARLVEFENLPALTIDLSGSSKAFVKTTAKTLTTDQTGASRLILRGQVDNLVSTLSGASRLTAGQMRVGQADVNASGDSEASFGDVPRLTQKTTGSSKVRRETGM